MNCRFEIYCDSIDEMQLMIDCAKKIKELRDAKWSSTQVMSGQIPTAANPT